ncbi:MAG: sodium/proline symporter PutP [Clostridia bacterium]|nr:sodium/proline symporter PutP [Clostridia bacterium]
MKLFAFVIYFAAMLGIGLYFFVKSKSGNDKDYFLGGRKMGPWVTAMSAQASDMSGWLLMGLPGSILALGLGQVWISVGLALGTALNWILIAKRLRKFSKAANDAITLPQYLSNRFATKNPALKIICAIVFLISFTIYVASAFQAGVNVFTSVIDIEPTTALIIFAVIILIYTFLGGYKAVCWTDFFQGMLMLVALLAVPIVIACTKNLDVNVLDLVYTTADGKELAFTKNPFAAPASEIISGLVWGLGYFGMPHILVRFMGIEKPSMIKKSATVSIIWVVLTLGAASLIAYFGRMILSAEFVAGNPEMIFIELVNDIFPPFIAGLLLSAIIAASMSTADSQLLVASSSFTSDIYKPIIKKDKASDKELLWMGRLVVVIISVIAFFMVKSGKCGTIMSMVENAWGLFGAAFGPIVILSLFWKRFTYSGAVAGIVTGAVVDIVWLMFLKASTGIYEILPGFVACLVVAVIVTLLSKAPSAEVCAIYDKATDNSVDD